MKLADRHCAPNAPALPDHEMGLLLHQVGGWSAAGGKLERCFPLRDFHETMAFVNALAWMIHQQDHHPDLEVGYNKVVVRYCTHSAGGALTENDFICAARASAIYAQRVGA
jgi:4a-hydroxytetrahydrobiopterin dehydratase